MGDLLTIWAFKFAWHWLPRMPEARAKRMFNLLADLVWLRNGPSVQQLQRNLGRVLSQDAAAVRDLTREGLRKYADYYRVLFQISGWSQDVRDARLVWHHRERVDEQLASGRGVILASSHSGNWDLAASVVGPQFGGVTTVAERLKPEALFDMFVQAREAWMLEILPHRGGARPALEVLKERLQQGRMVALVSDRDLSRRGVEVDFFDGRARMAAGPATLAVATGAALMPCAIWVDGDVTHILAHQPIDVDPHATDAVTTTTQRLADVFARDIALHPADWHMLQPVWLEDL